MTKKTFFVLIIFIIIIPGTVIADDYRWNLIDALTRNDMAAIENIIKTNASAMSAAEKMLITNFALNYSAGENTVKVCELLLKYKIYPNAYDLYTAINRNRQNDAIQLLLQNGASPNGEILLLTMERQRFDLAKQFIEAGVDVNFQYPQSGGNAEDGMTALLYAVKWKNFEMVKLLAENGANISIQAANGDTVLSIAKKNNNDDIYNYLLEHGAEEYTNNIQGQNAGIANILDDGIYNFKTGSYRLSGGEPSRLTLSGSSGNTRYMRFSGTSGSGSVHYADVLNSRSTNGFYRITGNNMTITLNGYSFIYRIDSGESFSGNGEVWSRTGN